MTTKHTRLAVVGGHRGADFDRALEAFQEQVELAAICDPSEKVLTRWKANHPDIQTFTSYDDLLETGDFDAVFIATPMELHARQAVQALEAGRHVLSEVIAATTLDECWQLVETVEKTGLVYMLAENYCYMRPNMMVLNMAQQGVFGEITYAEGAYIHDCRHLIFTDEGEITWRGDSRRHFNGNTYPTHSLGPVAQWLSINRKGGDRLVSTATWMNAVKSVPLYVRDRFGPHHPAAQDEFWAHGDSATTVIRTERGAVIVLRMDSNSPRPHNMTHYVLQGTRAAYLSARHGKEEALIWVEGQSPGQSPGEAEWEPLEAYSDEYEHPLWRQWGRQALELGHGGGDFLTLYDFFGAIQHGTRPPIDVYDAVTWSSIMPLSIQSVARGNVPVDVPDFTASRCSQSLGVR
jgi:predicted dehydrogenase